MYMYIYMYMYIDLLVYLHTIWTASVVGSSLKPEFTKMNDDTGLSVMRLQSMFMPHCCVVKSDPEPPSWSYEIPKPHVTPPSATFE